MIRSLVWVYEQNKVEQAEQVHVMSIVDEEDIQNFELSSQKSFKHQ